MIDYSDMLQTSQCSAALLIHVGSRSLYSVTNKEKFIHHIIKHIIAHYNYLDSIMHLSMSLPTPPPPGDSGELTVVEKFYIANEYNARLSPGGGGVGSDIDRCITCSKSS